VIDCQGETRAFWFVFHELNSTVVNGFLIRNCTASGTGAPTSQIDYQLNGIANKGALIS